MARPIAETPILTGEDAVRFDKMRVEIENLSSEERAANTEALNDAYQKALKRITICI